MKTNPNQSRKRAYKVRIARDAGIDYYQIFVGKRRIAEYISENWVDDLVNGFNMLIDKHNEDVLARRQLREMGK